jgi:hypothetical protein
MLRYVLTSEHSLRMIWSKNIDVPFPPDSPAVPVGMAISAAWPSSLSVQAEPFTDFFNGALMYPNLVCNLPLLEALNFDHMSNLLNVRFS